MFQYIRYRGATYRIATSNRTLAYWDPYWFVYQDQDGQISIRLGPDKKPITTTLPFNDARDFVLHELRAYRGFRSDPRRDLKINDFPIMYYGDDVGRQLIKLDSPK